MTHRLMPHGTVNNNLMPDLLAGPKVLDLNIKRQPTLVLTNVHGKELCLI